MLATGMDSERRDGRTDRASAMATRTARAARCTCSARRRTSSADTASSAHRSVSAPAWRSATGIAAMIACHADLFWRGRSRTRGRSIESLNLAALMKLPVGLCDREQPLRHGDVDGSRFGQSKDLSKNSIPG